MRFRRLCYTRWNGLGLATLDGSTLFYVYLSLLLILLALSTPSSAQDSFYRGKSIRIIVGTGAGGGYDLYSRALARHFGKHIPGNPAVIVENMTGAGGL